MPKLPPARGAAERGAARGAAPARPFADGDRRRRSRRDPLSDEDLQLALYLCYELHYRGLDGVDERWEWEPSLLALRARLEARFEDALLRLRRAAGRGARRGGDGRRAARDRRRRRGPVAVPATSSARPRSDQLLEFLVHRSAYQLKEADPHSWALPRLQRRGRRPRWSRSRPTSTAAAAPTASTPSCSRTRWTAVGLDPTYGAYLDQRPGRHPRHGQPDVAVRAAPPAARGDRRPPRAVRDDLLDPQPRYAARRCAGSATTAAATEFFDEHVAGRRRPREHRRGRPRRRARAPGAGARGADPVRRPRPRRCSTPAGALT